MGIPEIDVGPMTVEEFFAFTDSRPDDEKWELIEGAPVLNATPSYLHQRIAGNIHSRLWVLAAEQPRAWTVIPGIGVRITGTTLPVPDVLVRPDTPPGGNPRGRECDDMIAAFEVLSPSTSDRDLKWKRAAYAGLPSLMHYVVVAQDTIEVVVFARDTGFAERRLTTLDAVLALPPLGASLALADIYRGTGLK
jgi:Uma2 family endonuclease